MVRNSSLTAGNGIGRIGMVWLLLVVGALPVAGALLGETDWGPIPSVGVLCVLFASYLLVTHYGCASRPGRER